jgi:hypothetical protein
MTISDEKVLELADQAIAPSKFLNRDDRHRTMSIDQLCRFATLIQQAAQPVAADGAMPTPRLPTVFPLNTPSVANFNPQPKSSPPPTTRAWFWTGELCHYENGVLLMKLEHSSVLSSPSMPVVLLEDYERDLTALREERNTIVEIANKEREILRDQLAAREAEIAAKDAEMKEFINLTDKGSAKVARCYAKFVGALATPSPRAHLDAALAGERERLIDAADAVRLHLAEGYQSNIDNNCANMDGNMDWARLEGAVKVVAAIRAGGERE